MKDYSGELLKRVLTLIEGIFGSDSEFTRMCNLPHNFVTRAKRNGYINPTFESLINIKEGVEEKAGREFLWKWFLEGEPPMFKMDTEEKVEQIQKGKKDIREMTVEELVLVHPELNRRLSLLSSQVEMTRDFLNNFLPE